MSNWSTEKTKRAPRTKSIQAPNQQKVEDWKKSCDNVVVSKDKTETMSEKLERLQNELEDTKKHSKKIIYRGER